MSDSILDTIKQMLGVDPTDTSFDVDIITHINSAFSVLRQVGGTPEAGFSIIDKTTVWTDYFNGRTTIDFAKSYIYLSVMLIFDSPITSHAREAQIKRMQELEWRMTVEELTFKEPI